MSPETSCIKSVDLASAVDDLSGSGEKASGDLGDRLTYVVSVENPKDIVPPVKQKHTEAPADEIIEVKPQTEVEETSKDVEFTEEVLVFVPVETVVERPVEVIRYVEKPVIKGVVKFETVETDEIVEVPVPYPVTEVEYVKKFNDVQKQCCVAQTYLPKVGLSGPKTVDCTVYEPSLKVVDIAIPKIVKGALVCKGTSTKTVPVTSLSKAQYNTLVLKMNPILCEAGDINNLPVQAGTDGSVLAYKANEPVGIQTQS